MSYPSGMSMSTRTVRVLAGLLRGHRLRIGTRWRPLTPARQALLVLAHLRKGETYTDLASGFRVGKSTVSRYVAEAIGLLAALAPTLEQAITVAAGKAFVILDGTLLRIDRVGMGSGYDRAFYSGKHKCHGVNVQVIADPVGRLVWISPPLPGVRHDMGAARIHGIIDAVNTTGVRAVADTAYQGGGPAITVPHRRRRRDLDTGRYRPLPANQKAVNAAHARRRAPGERVNAELKNWKNLRTIRSSPSQAGQLIAAAPPMIAAT